MGLKCDAWRLSYCRSSFYATCVYSTILMLERASFAMCSCTIFFLPTLGHNCSPQDILHLLNFFFHHLFNCICWSNKEWRKFVLLCAYMSWRQQCFSPPFIYTVSLGASPVMLLLVSCFQFLAFMQYNVYVLRLSDRSVRVLSDYEIHDETVYNLQFSSFWGLSLVYVLSDLVIGAFTYWSDQIGSFFFFFPVRSADLLNFAWCSTVLWMLVPGKSKKCKAGLFTYLVLFEIWFYTFGTRLCSDAFRSICCHFYHPPYMVGWSYW